jgi:hypothetical protein
VWVPIGTSVLALGIWFLFNPGKDVGLGYFIAALTATYLGFTMTRLPYHAWGGNCPTAMRIAPWSLRCARSSASPASSSQPPFPAIILSRPGRNLGDRAFRA